MLRKLNVFIIVIIARNEVSRVRTNPYIKLPIEDWEALAANGYQ